jgi:hypothetical protein
MGRDHLGVPEVDEMILLKCYLKKFVGGNGQDHLTHGTRGRLG